MADLITTGTSDYGTGGIDSATVLVSNVSPISAKHPNGLASAIVQIETILGSGTGLKGTTAGLVTRLAVALASTGTIKLDGFNGLTADRGLMALNSTTLQVVNHTPIGLEAPWPTDTPPAQWLLENGQAVSRTTYAKYFALVGTTFGVGDGVTTFNLDDSRGRFKVGKDFGQGRTTAATAIGVHGGTETIDIAKMPSHDHVERAYTATNGAANSTVATTITTASPVNTTINTGATGGGQAFNPPFTVRNWIVFVGV